MENNQDAFPKGIYFDKPKAGTPDFVKGKISLSEGIIEYYNENKNEKGYVNIDLLVSKAGKLYLKTNDWKPTEEVKVEDVSDDSSPF